MSERARRVTDLARALRGALLFASRTAERLLEEVELNGEPLSLAERIRSRRITVGVIGLGYVGLPIALAYAEKGLRVIGVDYDEDKIAAIARGDSYLPDVSSEDLRKLSDRLHLSSQYEPLREADVVFIAVPTPLRGKSPDLSYLESSLLNLRDVLRRGQLIILESTVYPGCTRERVAEPLKGTFSLDEELFIAFSPERINPGSNFPLSSIPKVVGGIGPVSTLLASMALSLIYEKVVVVSSPEVAELAKLFENTFRAVNVALVNSFVRVSEALGVSVWEVLEAAYTKPFGIMRFSPGPGVGGHCIPVDPYYLLWRADELGIDMSLVREGLKVNDGMPEYVFSRLVELLNRHGRSVKGAKVLIIGVSYKPSVPDLRNSPALYLIDRLSSWGASVSYHDPWIPVLRDRAMSSVALSEELLGELDLVVIVTDHPEVNYRLIYESEVKVLDTRYAMYRRGYMREGIYNL